ncbi:MAG: hypothetical protein RR891_02780 [Clostridium sp.]
MSYRLLAGGIDILDKCNNITWSSDGDNLGMSLSFESLYDLGDIATITLIINDVQYFRGNTIKKVENKFSFSYTVFDYMMYLKNEVVKQFNNMWSSSAISSLLEEYGVESDVVFIPTIINKIYKTSISDIINDILKAAELDQGIKYFKEIENNKVVIRKSEDMKIYPKILFETNGGIENNIENMKNKVIVVSNEEDSTSINAESEDSASIAKYGLLQKLETVEVDNIAQAKNTADNLLKELNKISKTTTISALNVSGGEAVKAHRMIEVNDGKLNGWYKIKSVTHTLANNKHTINISLEW